MVGFSTSKAGHGSRSEHEEQREFVAWFRRAYPGVLIAAIPNGGKRSRHVAQQLKVEGVVAGMPDLVIPALRLWIEMKRESGGALSRSQRDVINYLLSVGYDVFVCHGCEEAKNKVTEFIKGMK